MNQNVRTVRSESPSGATGHEHFFAFSAGEKTETLPLSVENSRIDAIIDSGASCNLMSEAVFDKIQREAGVRFPVSACNRDVYTYASSKPLQIIGECKLKVGVEETGKSTDAHFIIIPDRHITLLGRQSSEILGVLKVGLSVNECETQSKGLADLKEKYPEVFTGLGKLKDYQLKLHLDKSVTPVAQAVRRIPYSRRQKVVDKLDELERLDVIEKVSGPTTWVNPLVTVDKPNGDVRICLDMRRANQAITRERHPIPTMEETLQNVGGAKVFAKLDMNMAFHQIELDVDSRDITTFAGPNGLYRYKRLLFGVNMATEKFQHIMWQIVQGLPGVHSMHDDIRVVADNHNQLYERVEAVVKAFSAKNLTLNFDKCIMGADKMTFMGETITSTGLKVSDDKAKAITHAPRPTTKSELRSFLGLAQFCAKYVAGFATITSSLWELTRASAEWNWTSKEEAAFNELKRQLTQAPVMAYFKQGAPTRVVTDASGVGLGAILEQQQPDGLYRPVYYASKKLSSVEQRYSQFERETLGARWACQKFYLFLSGIDFELHTDHKGLVTMLGPKSTPPSPRIERWLLYMQQFNYEVKHIPGKANYADVLSRLQLNDIDIHTRQTEEYAYCVVKDAVPNALSARQIERASAEDVTLQKISKSITTDEWMNVPGYAAVKHELWLLGELVMRGNRIVIPESLWDQTILLAHEGHQGMVRTKSRLREKVWWPDMDRQVEKLIRSCHACQLVGPRQKPTPVKSTVLPEGPWTHLAADLLELSGGDHLLVIIDYFSRWPEVFFLKKTDASRVIKCMETAFNTHGLPHSLRTDNGPPFASHDFESFLSCLAVDHKKGIPYWPQSNGEVERFNETLLKIVRIAKLEKKDVKREVSNSLFQYRTTPHTVIGMTPAN